MSAAQTSHIYPRQINTVQTPGGELIGIIFCPGKKNNSSLSGFLLRRSLIEDCLDRIAPS
jgi:hypothetical protein